MNKKCLECGKNKDEFFMQWVPKEQLSKKGIINAKKRKSQYLCDDCNSK